MAERGDDAAQREIGRPEIVPPLTYAVRFVDDEERNRNGLEQPQEGLVLELFGRRINDAEAPRGDALASAQFLIFRERRVECDDVGDAALAQHVELILHQGDQRTDDDGRTLEQQRGQLVRQALARARRKNSQRILAI